ncbi:hypothetical protein AMAG_01548 [Allomyces macrogynus ATCC 38327]|uniref:Exocyst complex component Sec3 PIP2-binding N-terminal domain-containing protein n=1 Tax=Allomyces macrogynus (strain ATCC 38327) TaxID=578462 RepID=A0A0L0RZY0_ALLM3|nr:hypothetical protein AMAG_01548 [Allomyces macrogynus ATCC 38327]|eukprot:KNE55661.1 hypothetical protein AMAG_01548 [Allomyces macrogynus ATCC 38327]
MSLAAKQQLTAFFRPSGEALLGVVQLVRDEAKRARETRDDPRYLCITAKRNGKAKLNKVKYNASSNSYSVTKSLLLSELQVVEVIDRSTFVTVFSKPQTWQCTDPQAKDEFLTTLLKLTKKSPPKLINVDQLLMKASNYDLTAEGRNTGDSAAPAPKGEDAAATGGLVMAQELVNIDELLKDFNWRAGTANNAAALERKLQQELSQIESENINALIESTARTQLICAQIDKAVAKLDAMSAWLGEYTTDLNRIGSQVTFIQGRNRALINQAANQQLLRDELAAFLRALALPAHVGDTLVHAPLDSGPAALARIEEAAQALLAGMQAQLDPDLRHMAVVREQAEHRTELCQGFIQRLAGHLRSAISLHVDAYCSDKSRLAKRGQLRLPAHDALEEELARYQGLTRWLYDADLTSYQELVSHYLVECAKVYRIEVKELLDVLRTHHLAKPSEEAEWLFGGTSNLAPPASALNKNLAGSKAALSNVLHRGHTRKESSMSSGSGGAKPTATLTRGNTITESSNNLAVSSEEKLDFVTAFTQILQLLIPTMLHEQTFLVTVFSLERAASMNSPEKVKDMLGVLFDGVAKDLDALIDIGLRDGSTSIAMLNVVERHLGKVKPTEMFVYDLLSTLQARLKGAWSRFVDHQVHAIQESKMSKKKSGLLSFVRTLPNFIEHMEDSVESPPPSVRALLNQGYEQLVKLVVHSIESIPAIDDDVLILENTMYLTTELAPLLDPTTGIASAAAPALTDPLSRLADLTRRHLDAYTHYLLRKAFGKLVDFVQGIETLLTTQAPDEVVYHQAYTRATAKKLLAQYPPKEVAKCIEYMYKKVTKALDDPDRVWPRVVDEVEAFQARAARMVGRVYGVSAVPAADGGAALADPIRVEFTLADVRAACAAVGK